MFVGNDRYEQRHAFFSIAVLTQTRSARDERISRGMFLDDFHQARKSRRLDDDLDAFHFTEESVAAHGTAPTSVKLLA
jgi:hypothetical protein